MKYLMGLLMCTLLLSSSTLLSFTWSTVQNLSSTGSNAGFQTVGIDSSGNAVAVWVAVTGNIVQGATYNFGTGVWTPTNNLGTVGLTTDQPPFVAVNASGFAVAVWGGSGSAPFIAATLAFGSHTSDRDH